MCASACPRCRLLTGLLAGILLFAGVRPVSAQNVAPVAVDDDYLVEAGETLTVDAPGIIENDYDPEGGSITAVSFSQPADGTVSLNTAGEMTYTPDGGFTGTDSFAYTIRDDAGAEDAGTVTILVPDRPNRDPVAVDDVYTVMAGETLSVNAPGIIGNDYDPDGDDLIAASFFQPANGSVSLNTAGEMTYTPDDGFTGTDSFTYSARDDNGAEDTGTVTIEVQSDPNRRPVALDDSYSVVAGQTLTVNAPGIIGNDYDPDGDDLIAASFFQPVNGSVSLNTAGEMTYTPDAGFTGTDSFTYTTRDDANANSTGSVTIEVIPASQTTPVAMPDAYRTETGSPLEVAAPGVLANDSAPAGSFIVSSYTSPSNGTVNGFTDGTIEYTPDAGFTGTDTFSYTLRDSNSNQTTGTVTIEVTNTNRPPIALSDTYLAVSGETLTVDAPGIIGNDYDPDGDDLIAASFFQPANGSVSLNTAGEVSYTPDDGFAGPDSFTYTIRDDADATDSGTVTFEVQPNANRSPTAVTDRYSVFQDRTLTVNKPGILANDYDPDGDPITAISFSQPANGTVSLNTAGTLTYTPDAGFVGTDSFSYRIRDAGSATDGSSVEVIVASDAVLPVELAGLNATADDGRVTVTWQTLSETNNARFEVQRRLRADDAFQLVGTVDGAGTTTERQDYRFVDTLPFTAEQATYRLQQIDVDGSRTLSDPIAVSRSLPSDVTLLGAAPHPVQQHANVVYTLPNRTDVRLEIYDVLGRRVATLVNQTQSAGRKAYSLTARDLASGTYLLVLSADDKRRTERLTIVR